VRQAVGQASGVPVWDGAWRHSEVHQAVTRKQWPRGSLAPGGKWIPPGDLEQLRVGRARRKYCCSLLSWCVVLINDDALLGSRDVVP